MRRMIIGLASLGLALVASEAGALDIPKTQVLIESRVVEADKDFTRELGINFGLGGQRSFNDDVRFGPLTVDNEPTGGFLKDFDTDNSGFLGQFGVDLVGPPVEIFGVPWVMRFAAGMRGSDGDTSERIDLLALQQGAQAEIISLPGTQSFPLNDPNAVTFSFDSRYVEAGGAAALQTQLTDGVQLQTGIQAGYVNQRDRTKIAFNNAGQDLRSNLKTTVESDGATLLLNVTPIITLGDRVDLSLGVSGGGTFLSADLTANQTLDGGTPERRTDSSVVIGGLVGGNFGVNVRPFENNRSTIGIQGGVTYLSNIPVLGTLFRNKGAEIDGDDRTELVILVTARIVLPD